MAVITCHNLSKNFKRRHALQQLNFTIEDNKITGLIGRNGAGKTTLMKILAGYYRKTSGEVTVFSESPFNNLQASANTVFMSDDISFTSSLSLQALLTEGDRFYDKWQPKLAEKLLAHFELDGASIFKKLSQGQKSTFRCIFAIASHAPLTILDEPANGMDESVRKDIYRALLKDYMSEPRNIILSSHHLEEVEDLLEDVLLLDQGEVVRHVSMEDLQSSLISLTGHTAIVQKMKQEVDILYEASLAQDYEQVIIPAHVSLEKRLEWEKQGIHCRPVPAADAIIYLTQQRKGRIDDVFV